MAMGKGKRVIALFAIAIALLTALVFACSSFEASTVEPAEAGADVTDGSSDATSSADATSDAAEDAGANCFSLLTGLRGFALTGTARHEVGKGVVLEMKSDGGDGNGSEASIIRNVPSDGGFFIKRSRVDVDLDVVRGPEQFGSAGDDFVQLLTQYYGIDTSETAVGVAALLVSQQMKLVVNAKGSGASTRFDIGIQHPTGANATLSETIDWGSDAGRIDLSSNGAASIAQNISTLEVARQSNLSVRVGGAANSLVPSYTFTIKKVCVTLE